MAKSIPERELAQRLNAGCDSDNVRFTWAECKALLYELEKNVADLDALSDAELELEVAAARINVVQRYNPKTYDQSRLVEIYAGAEALHRDAIVPLSLGLDPQEANPVDFAIVYELLPKDIASEFDRRVRITNARFFDPEVPNEKAVALMEQWGSALGETLRPQGITEEPIDIEELIASVPLKKRFAKAQTRQKWRGFQKEVYLEAARFYRSEGALPSKNHVCEVVAKKIPVAPESLKTNIRLQDAVIVKIANSGNSCKVT